MMTALEAMQRDLQRIARNLPRYDGTGYRAAAEVLSAKADECDKWADGFTTGAEVPV